MHPDRRAIHNRVEIFASQVGASHHLRSRNARQSLGRVPDAAHRCTQSILPAPAQTRPPAPRLPPQTAARGFPPGACGAPGSAARQRSPYCTRTSVHRHEPPRYSPLQSAPPDGSQSSRYRRIVSLCGIVHGKPAIPNGLMALKKSRRFRTRNGTNTASNLRARNAVLCSNGESEWPIGSPITP